MLSTFSSDAGNLRKRLESAASAVLISLAVLTAAPAAAQPQDVQRMLSQKNCLACHAWDKKLVGPAYGDVRARYGAGDVARLAAKVMNGGFDEWGRAPCPPKSQVSRSEAEFLVAGILGVPVGAIPPAPTYTPPPQNPSSLPDDPPTEGRMFRLN